MGRAMSPIRSKEEIQKIKDWLLKNKGYKYYFLWTLGTNTGLRISDLLSLRVRDVRGKTQFAIVTEKTKKEVWVILNPYIRDEIKKYTEGMEEHHFLFQSRVGVNKKLTRQMASSVLTEAATVLGIERMNSHSMRKSFGYWYYKQNQDVYYLMKLFGHRTQTQTLQYIGVELEEIEKTMQNFAV